MSLPQNMFTAAVAAAFVVGAPSLHAQDSAQAGQPTQDIGAVEANVPVTDSSFVRKATTGNLAEIQLGQLAARRAQNESVKKFAKRMEEDHEKANDQLKAVAKRADLRVPSIREPEQRQTSDSISRLTGAEFDRAYMQHMVQDHQKAVDLYQRASTGLSDSGLQRYAADVLPTLQEHLTLAQQTAGEIGVPGVTAQGAGDTAAVDTMGYRAPQRDTAGFEADTAAFPADTAAFPADTAAAPADTAAFPAPADTAAMPADTMAFPADTAAMPADTAAFPADTTAFPADTSPTPTDTTAFPAPADTVADTTVSYPAPPETPGETPADTSVSFPADTTAMPPSDTSVVEPEDPSTVVPQ